MREVEVPWQPEGLIVIAVSEGETFTVQDDLPRKVNQFIETLSSASMGILCVARKDLVLVARYFNPEAGLIVKIKFVRADRAKEGAQNLQFAEIKPFQRLRAALIHVGVPQVYTIGGFRNALCYADEWPVQSRDTNAFSGWIVQRSEIDKYLKVLPQLVDSGELASVWIEKAGVSAQDFAIRVFDHDPKDEPPLIYTDPSTNATFEEPVRRIFRVDYDTGSLIVKKTTFLATGETGGKIVLQAVPFQKELSVGRRLTSELRLAKKVPDSKKEQ